MKKILCALLVALMFVLIPFQGFAHGKSNLEIVSKVNEGSNKYMNWSLTTPQVKGLKNRSVERSINKQFRNDVNNFKKEVLAMAKEAYKESQETGFPFNPFQAYTEYDLHLLKPKLLSLTMNVYQFTGGAHGFTVKKAYNYNLKTGKELGYQDIFKDCDYKSVIIARVSEEIRRDPEIYFDDALDTVKNFTDDQPFYITKEGIVVYYGLYEIAPYAAGIREFLIPFTDCGCS
ncbi:MAG: DUF3298 and DUF4163 domain-containing protein [Clostridiales bacterium]|nr:DUF3298 and DUF4163 domain-containing protein [Clostridiales bacterium]